MRAFKEPLKGVVIRNVARREKSTRLFHFPSFRQDRCGLLVGPEAPDSFRELQTTRIRALVNKDLPFHRRDLRYPVTRRDLRISPGMKGKNPIQNIC